MTETELPTGQPFTVEPGQTGWLPEFDGQPKVAHVFQRRSLLAIRAALGAERPLLLRGEPGTGKSQLARAAAYLLGRAFVAKVVDIRTETQDLFWSLDVVERLAQAQLMGALKQGDETTLSELLDERRFVTPGPLWWAFDWTTASEQAGRRKMEPPKVFEGGRSDNGVVLLIDEIDKADGSVPNGLLEALGNGRFEGPGDMGTVHRSGTPPLVVITTNEERALPDAFLRRCLVLHLRLPKDPEELRTFLIERGQAHFSECDPKVLAEAARLLVKDRTAWQDRGLTPPGQAEYLDLIRAVTSKHMPGEDPLELLKELSELTFQKHPLEDLGL